MNGIKSLMSKKIGGIPVLYIVALAVAVLAVVAMRMKPTTTTGDTETGTSADGPAGVTTDAETEATADYGFAATRGTVTVTDQDGTTTTATATDNNDLWAKRAIEWLIAQGSTAGDAQTAITKYLDGYSLSYAEGVLRDKAVKQFGLPPEPVTPGSTGAAPAKRQGNPPTTHIVRGPNDNSYTDIARLYYSRTDDLAGDLLQAANTRLGPKGPFPVGTKVSVPKYHDPKYITSRSGQLTLAQIASKNGTSQQAIIAMNDGVKFPVKPGKRIRVA